MVEYGKVMDGSRHYDKNVPDRVGTGQLAIQFEKDDAEDVEEAADFQLGLAVEVMLKQRKKQLLIVLIRFSKVPLIYRYIRCRSLLRHKKTSQDCHIVASRRIK